MLTENIFNLPCYATSKRIKNVWGLIKELFTTELNNHFDLWFVLQITRKNQPHTGKEVPLLDASSRKEKLTQVSGLEILWLARSSLNPWWIPLMYWNRSVAVSPRRDVWKRTMENHWSLDLKMRPTLKGKVFEVCHEVSKSRYTLTYFYASYFTLTE